MRNNRSPFSIVMVFVQLGIVWIVITSIVVHFIHIDRDVLVLLGPLNAAVFVIIAAFLMHQLIVKAQNKIRASWEQLSESRLQLLEVLEKVPIILMAADKNGVITISEGSGPYLVAYKLKEIVGRSVYEVFKNNEDICQDFERALAGASSQKIRTWGNHIFQCYFRPSYNQHGDVRAVMGVGIDITERIKYERKLIKAKEEAERANRVRSEFIANLSHEIRTPLNIITGFASVLIAKHSSEMEEEDQELYSNIDEASERLMNTVEKLLDISRFRNEDFQTELTNISLSQIFSDMYYDFAKKAEKKGLDFTVSFPEKDIHILADEHALRRALTEVLDNAVKFTPDGKISIRAQKGKDDRAIIMIRDTGIGIDPGFGEKAFEEFSQEESGYSRSYDGTGLGLALAKNFIELCGGEIRLESEKGKGTMVMIYIPISQEAEAAVDSQAD